MAVNNHIKNIILTPFNLLFNINPVFCTKVIFRLKLGEKLDLSNPITFNQKLQWIKLYDKNPLMPICVDKYTVRDYVKKAGCEEILNDLIWEGYSPADIPFEQLPNKCVIKVTHGQGMNIIVKNLNKLNIKTTIKQLQKWLKEKYLPCYGEWFYGQVKPRVIVEAFLGNNMGEEPIDYKVFCFNGVPKLIDVHTGRFTNHKRNFYDLDWNVIRGVGIKYPTDEDAIVPRPDELNELLKYAKLLSKPFKHARADFYIVDHKVYFGELTFTNGAGFDPVFPREFDIQLGEYINLEGN